MPLELFLFHFILIHISISIFNVFFFYSFLQWLGDLLIERIRLVLPSLVGSSQPFVDDGTYQTGSFFDRMALACHHLFSQNSLPLQRLCQSQMDFQERARRLLVTNSSPRRGNHLSSPLKLYGQQCNKYMQQTLAQQSQTK
jgi:hypothetical protein